MHAVEADMAILIFHIEQASVLTEQNSNNYLKRK